MTTTRKTNTIDMTSGAILPKMLRFALPLMLSSILQLLFNAADIVVVGQFCGDASLAAVSSNGSVVNLITGLFIGMSVGVNVLAARFFGSKDEQGLSDTLHTAVVISVICGALVTVLGLVIAPQMLILMKTPDNVLPLATLYLRIYFCGMISTLVYNFGAAVLRAVGDTRRPLIFLLIAGVLNVVLNLIFVTVFHMDVAGVALATILSQTLSAFLVIHCLLHEEGGLKLSLKKLHCDRTKLLQILRIGLPAGLQSTLFSLSNVVIQSSVNIFGDVVMSGNGAAANIEGFGYMAMNAFYQATISFTGQNYGKRRYDRIIRTQLIGQACVLTVGLVFSLVCTLLGRPLLGIYTDSEAVVEAGLTRLSYVGTLYFFCGMMEVVCGGLRGIGSSFIPMIISLLGACGLRILWVSTVFQIPAYHTIDTVYVSYPISWIVTAIVQLIFFIFCLRRVMKRDSGN
ncbi:MAG: MATE family efflux transporter [Ruminococcaceae bacterium]|nr:MATE family efflux transporter [Oscillospiraceae bacterium]